MNTRRFLSISPVRVLGHSAGRLIFFASLLVATAAVCNAAPTAQISLVPLSPQEYEPFRVVATFSEDVCLSTNAPGYARVRFASNVLDVQLSHLKTGNCTRTREFAFAGLPAGNHTVQLSLTSRRASLPTDGYDGGTTIVATIGTSALAVRARSNLVPQYWFTGRIDGDSVFSPYSATENGGGPVVIWSQHGAPLTGGGDWLDVGPPYTIGYTFQAWQPGGGLPLLVPKDAQYAAFENIYRFDYPKPLQGAFMATDSDCLVATRTFVSPTATQCINPFGYVLKYRNGACPMGASPVYRLFHPVSIAHRYVQSADTYVALQSYGYVGEGPQFCAPKRPDGIE